MKSQERVQKILLTLDEQEIELLLIALGRYQNYQYDRGYRAKNTEKLITKIYRSMGVKL